MMTAEGFQSTLAAARAGAEWAFAALFQAHQPRLLRYLQAQHRDADDLASETWLDAARNLPRFAGDEDDFRGWLFTIARRRLVDRRRSEGRRPQLVTATPPESAAASAEDDAFAQALGDDAARRIVAVLPDDQAEIVLLRVVAGLAVDQVAAITGRRPGTVRVLQHRALSRLAKKLSDDL